ncbi:acetoacetate decarboxylase family protein [Agrobacterium tumefaciens]|uniref:acetoacetate decarboxylase family protein n=1 Tax=Agrobacterium tumefaciens complex TaxID=1183400 RepID=UPI0015726D3A|nr:acetoacetate decarboxylase family protein [Agrobacterium fabrum]NSZ09731.1 acetoacetate decarboxylase family protein [Agrobacterium tumefaciens]
MPMTYSFRPDRIYRMPTHFGPSVSPRQGPDGQLFDWSEHHFDAASIYFRSSTDALEALLPPGFSLHVDPVVTVTFAFLRNLPWLAGRGYNTLGVRIPAVFHGKAGKTTGSLSLVLWENMADPITTGREELGVAKIFCDIPEPSRSEGTIGYEASWYGFRFLSMELEDLQPADSAKERVDLAPDTGGNLLHYKYMPRTGAWGAADAAYTTLTPPVRNAQVKTAFRALGTFAFNRPRWVDMPTQSHIVNGLADLPVVETLGASLVTVAGNFDLYDQKQLA